MATEVIVTTKKELEEVIESVMIKMEAKKNRGVGERLYYVGQVAKMLGKAHDTIKKLVKNGTIRSTKDGLIPESAIEEYLNSK